MIIDIPSERRSTRVVGLTGNVRYTFKVKARTSAGFGAEAEFTNSTYAGGSDNDDDIRIINDICDFCLFCYTTCTGFAFIAITTTCTCTCTCTC